MSAVLAAGDVLAKSGEAAKSGPIGFAVILVLCVICYFLFKSMSRHLKHVRQDFPAGRGDAPAGPAVARSSAEPAAPAAPEAADAPADPAEPADANAPADPTQP
jgi:predicted lipid-binding transport protein (Tim44 family)